MQKDELLLIEKEIKGCFDFFWNESNTDSSVGYGLTVDITGKKTSSIASIGFAFPAYIIGIERNYITYEQGKERVLKTIETILKLEHKEGFLPHFFSQETATNLNSEFSTIDSGLLFAGLITVAEYFKEEISDLVNKILDRVNWNVLLTKKDGKTQFKMAYFLKNKYHEEGWSTVVWDHYAEQLILYILYAGSKNCDEITARELYYGFERNIGAYKSNNLVYCYGNALFIHQFSHCFFDFSEYVDEKGFNWFNNSKEATIANRAYCIDQKWSKTYNENSWGLTAFHGKNGYKVYGALPFGYCNNDYKQDLDGSVAPYASLSSIVFTPKESIECLKYFNTIEGLNQKYGLTDSYNFENERYISDKYLGIDKGPTIIMLDNYLNKTTWKYFMQSDIVKKAIKILKFKKI